MMVKVSSVCAHHPRQGRANGIPHTEAEVLVSVPHSTSILPRLSVTHHFGLSSAIFDKSEVRYHFLRLKIEGEQKFYYAPPTPLSVTHHIGFTISKWNIKNK